MSKLDANVDAWADALRGVEASEPGGTAGEPDVLIERRQEHGGETGPAVELRIRDAAGEVSSVVLSSGEARTLAEQLQAAASDPPPGAGGDPDGT